MVTPRLSSFLIVYLILFCHLTGRVDAYAYVDPRLLYLTRRRVKLTTFDNDMAPVRVITIIIVVTRPTADILLYYLPFIYITYRKPI
ncbi:hypothetical protein F5880DRAFT_239432 [Lentinula raphanica]|nr:hypothetical protein F5880DRAFT_239432 [Lentinula raphanica]